MCTQLTLREQQANTLVREDTLLHWESLSVVSTSNAEDVSLELITERISWDFMRDALLVEGAHLQLIVDLNGFLSPMTRV